MRGEWMFVAAAALTAAPALAQSSSAAAPATENAAPAADAAAAQPAATPAAPPKVTQGATVFDVSGGEVGTVESVSGDLAVVSTGKNKARLPLSSFAAGEKGLLLGMTREQLDAAASAAAAGASDTGEKKAGPAKGASK